jgi:hypothetical protein
MKCTRENCRCLIEPGKGVERDGNVYCCEKCATECTDDACVCTPCDCPK